MSILGVVLMLATATAAFAFTAQSGFSATTYATGYPTGGPAGVAFISGAMYTVDPADNGLYTNALSGAPTRVGTVPGAPTGLASFGPSLYAIDSASRSVVQLDPATGGVLATLGGPANFGGAQLNGIATDPVTGDLYVVTSTAFLYEIPAVAPRTPAFALVLTAQPSTFALAVAPDHSIYVAVEGAVHGIWQITPAPAHAQSLIGPDFIGARGVGVIPGFIFVNNADGSIMKIVIPGVGTGSTAPALLGGAAGSFAAIGTDGCFYASQGATVVRLANADGSCNLANAAPPPPPATLTLSRISTNQPLIGNGDQSFTATIGNASGTANVPVTFTVTNSLGATTTYNALASNNGVATFSYAATVVGTDSIQASATVNGTPITSNVVTVTYPRALDTVPPIITYSVSGTAGANFACPNTTLGTIGVKEYCGWYVSPPTVHFTVTRGVGGTTDPVYSCPDFTLNVNSPIDGTPTTCNAANGDGKSSAFTVVLQALITRPTVLASGSTAGGPYAAGTWTNRDVTVSFTCATDPNLGPAGIPPGGCTPAQVVAAEGSTSVSGSVLDIAGTRVTTTFGPVLIDKTPPTISVAATLAGGGTYTFGSWTNQNVTLTFTCADGGALPSGLAAPCPAPIVVSASRPATTVSIADVAGNTATVAVGAVNIAKTPPTITASATAGGVAYTGLAPTNKTVVVSFSCTSAGAPVTTCPAAQTFANEGSSTATGTAIDAAGNSASATFGPFSIDKTPPTITVRASLPDGSLYSGAWTTQNVILTYSCADAAGVAPSGIDSCPPTTTVTATQPAFTATATDTAGNRGTVAVGPINIDRTPPTITATATSVGAPYAGTAPGSPPIVVTFTCTTDGAPVSCPAPITYSIPGTYTATGTATDSAGNTASTSFGPFTVLPTQPSTLTITSPAFLAQGATTVSAKLLTPGGVPIAGKTVTFTAGAASATAVTDVNGVASASLTLGPGAYTLKAAFAGDGGFFASAATQSLTVGAATQFVIWGGNPGGVLVGQRVVFWGEKWWDQVSLPESAKVKSFKGWADSVAGTTWTAKPGNSKPPESIPSYISVIVTTSIERADAKDDGKGITGTIVRHAILRVDSTYKDEPSKPVYGVVVAFAP